jgi:hypothetical protein
MSLLTGSVREVGDARPMDIVLLGADGLPVFGFNPSRPDTAVLNTLTFTGATQLISASNPARRKLIVYNATNKTLYIAFAATATLVAYTVPVAVNTPFEIELDGYTGDVSGILAGAPSGVNKVYVTELT